MKFPVVFELALAVDHDAISFCCFKCDIEFSGYPSRHSRLTFGQYSFTTIIIDYKIVDAVAKETIFTQPKHFDSEEELLLCLDYFKDSFVGNIEVFNASASEPPEYYLFYRRLYGYWGDTHYVIGSNDAALIEIAKAIYHACSDTPIDMVGFCDVMLSLKPFGRLQLLTLVKRWFKSCDLHVDVSKADDQKVLAEFVVACSKRKTVNIDALSMVLKDAICAQK